MVTLIAILLHLVCFIVLFLILTIVGVFFTFAVTEGTEQEHVPLYLELSTHQLLLIVLYVQSIDDNRSFSKAMISL